MLWLLCNFAVWWFSTSWHHHIISQSQDTILSVITVLGGQDMLCVYSEKKWGTLLIILPFKGQRLALKKNSEVEKHKTSWTKYHLDAFSQRLNNCGLSPSLQWMGTMWWDISESSIFTCKFHVLWCWHSN